MNRFLILFLLVACIAMGADFGNVPNPAGAQYLWDGSKWVTMSGTASGTTNPGGMNTGFIALATSSLSVGTSAAVIAGTMPRDHGELLIGVTGGDLNFGGAAVPTGANYPYYLASGSFMKWEGIGTTTPAIYFRGRSGTVTVTLGFVGE